MISLLNNECFHCQKMVYPKGLVSGLIGEALDAIGDAIFGGDDDNGPAQPIPRENYPRTLFIWGLTRVLPVVIDSMTITEQEYDFILNPVRAEVSLGLSIIVPTQSSDDVIAKGAFEFSNLAKDLMAISNLANTASEIVDLIPF